MPSKKMEYRISMECSECKRRNYYTFKTKKIKEKLELKKHCKFCKKHTTHKENK